MSFSRPTLPALIGAAVLLFLSSTPAFAQKGGGKPQAPTYPYKYTDLGSRTYSNPEEKAYGITEPDADGALLVVGGGVSTISSLPAAWTIAQAGQVLGDGGLPFGSARTVVAVNDAGRIAYTGWRDGRYAPLVDVPGAGQITIPASGFMEMADGLYHFRDFRPRALNNAGVLVGHAAIRPVQIGATSIDGGLLWTVDDAGTVDGPIWLGSFRPYAINDLGLMAGEQDFTPAIAWLEDGELRVETLEPTLPGRATAVNNFGEVVGIAIGLSRTYRMPFAWSWADGLRALAEDGEALDINDAGHIVGRAWNKGEPYACLWVNGQPFDLNALSGAGTNNFRLNSAEGINNAGNIVGRYVSSHKGQWFASGSFLLTPNP
jgi:probable HAF family extracellular repeat protein